MKFFAIAGCLLLCINTVLCAQESGLRWSAEKANKWYAQQPWYTGFNYIPAYAINYTAMWDKSSFNPDAIDKELSLASQSGMNVLRAVLQYAVYKEDPAYFIRTLDQFMTICAKYHIRFVPTFFDDCVFGIEHDPKTGKQPEPLEGWYAWAWSPSPGHSLVIDTGRHAELESYVKTILKKFATDERVLFWDLYNEPTNGGLGTASFPLVKKVIRWAREVNPSQPISIGVWDNNKKLNAIILEASDVISFHHYGNSVDFEKKILELQKTGRPVFCTEWMNRSLDSKVATHLPVLYKYRVGSMLWGLVNGKTQTHLPWGHRPGDPPPKVWQHDLYKGDFTAYDTAEINLIQGFLKESKRLR